MNAYGLKLRAYFAMHVIERQTVLNSTTKHAKSKSISFLTRFRSKNEEWKNVYIVSLLFVLGYWMARVLLLCDNDLINAELYTPYYHPVNIPYKGDIQS